MPRKKVTTSYIDRLEQEIENNQSRLSLILGVLIIIVAGVLLFNYLHKNKAELGPAQNTTNTTILQQDVTPEQLPGKYTVKADDTLFDIAQKYYNDGYKYNQIAQANNLANADQIEIGQVLQIPKLENTNVSPTTMQNTPTDTQWGPKITSDTYTVVEGDWLSTIADRAYGDIMVYRKLAQANNIANPDLIEPGQVLKIPR